MSLFLVRGTVSRQEYMSDDREGKDITRLVSADSEAEAEAKFCNFYEDKTVEYATYYSVYNTIATGVIE